jgi:hypothetical protein
LESVDFGRVAEVDGREISVRDAGRNAPATLMAEYRILSGPRA